MAISSQGKPYDAGCQDIFDKVQARELARGSSKLKAFLYARVAADNCMNAGGGDPPSKTGK